MQTLWNEKFSRAGFLYGVEPNSFVVSLTPKFPNKGRILCLGEGEGRNAIFLAKEGFSVEAMDASDIGLRKLQTRANKENLSIIMRHTLLENWEAPYLYDAVISTYMHLTRPLQLLFFQKALSALKMGSLFVCEVFSTKQLAYTSGGPKDINLLYDMESLYPMLQDLPCRVLKVSEEIVELSEGTGHQGEACVIRVILEKQ